MHDSPIQRHMATKSAKIHLKENRNSSSRVTNISRFVFIEANLEIKSPKPKCSILLLTFIKRNGGCH